MISKEEELSQTGFKIICSIHEPDEETRKLISRYKQLQAELGWLLCSFCEKNILKEGYKAGNLSICSVCYRAI